MRVFLVPLFLVLTLSIACSSPKPTDTPNSTSTPQPTATNTPAPAPTPTLQLTVSPTTATPEPTPIPEPTATQTPLPSATPTPALLPTATPTPTPNPTATATSTPTPTPTATPSPPPTPIPSPTPSRSPHQIMLDLINEEREQAGVPRVEFGNNPAAQIHAEAASEGCFSGHWGLDGLNPAMRYGLAGGHQSSGENMSGLRYCIQAWEHFATIKSLDTEISEAMAGFMGSPGHRETLLDPRYTKVNIGLAWSEYILTVVQQFEADFVHFDQEPQLSNDVLMLSGSTRNGAGFPQDTGLKVSIYYHPPPHPLTLGQLFRPGCTDIGLQVASLRRPAPQGSSYPSDTFSKSYNRCLSPYDESPDTPAPSSYEEAKTRASSIVRPTEAMVNWITAEEWKTLGTDFAISADLGTTLTEHGPGIYIVYVWARINGEPILISEYPIFHDIPIPTGYD